MNLPYHFKRTRVKICGFTRSDDARAAARLGADAIGLVFYPASPRHVEIARAQEIARALPPFISVVALFVDAEENWVRKVIQQVPVDLLQFHGNESAQACRSFGLPYIKAIRMGEGVELASLAEHYYDARGLLLDAYHPAAQGGTGCRFDWNRVPDSLSLPVVLAGGLGPDNVRLALETASPQAVDVSSGVESARGIKDPSKMAAFIKEVHDFDYKN